MANKKDYRKLKEMLPNDAVVKFKGKGSAPRPFVIVIERTETQSKQFDWLRAGAISLMKFRRVSDALNAFKNESRWIQSRLYGANPRITFKNEKTGEDLTGLLTGDV